MTQTSSTWRRCVQTLTAAVAVAVATAATPLTTLNVHTDPDRPTQLYPAQSSDGSRAWIITGAKTPYLNHNHNEHHSTAPFQRPPFAYANSDPLTNELSDADSYYSSSSGSKGVGSVRLPGSFVITSRPFGLHLNSPPAQPDLHQLSQQQQQQQHTTPSQQHNHQPNPSISTALGASAVDDQSHRPEGTTGAYSAHKVRPVTLSEPHGTANVHGQQIQTYSLGCRSGKPCTYIINPTASSTRMPSAQSTPYDPAAVHSFLDTYKDILAQSTNRSSSSSYLVQKMAAAKRHMSPMDAYRRDQQAKAAQTHHHHQQQQPHTHHQQEQHPQPQQQQRQTPQWSSDWTSLSSSSGPAQTSLSHLYTDPDTNSASDRDSASTAGRPEVQHQQHESQLARVVGSLASRLSSWQQRLRWPTRPALFHQPVDGTGAGTGVSRQQARVPANRDHTDSWPWTATVARRQSYTSRVARANTDPATASPATTSGHWTHTSAADGEGQRQGRRIALGVRQPPRQTRFGVQRVTLDNHNNNNNNKDDGSDIWQQLPSTSTIVSAGQRQPAPPPPAGGVGGGTGQVFRVHVSSGPLTVQQPAAGQFSSYTGGRLHRQHAARGGGDGGGDRRADGSAGEITRYVSIVTDDGERRLPNALFVGQ